MKISIVIPTYNRLYTLPRVLDSFAAQTFTDWECIVVDDHSTDDTKSLVMEYAHNDSRFRYVLNTCAKGAQGARNTGIAQAQGEWIALFDSDDYAYPNFLETLFAHTARNVDVVTSQANMVDAHTGEVLEVANWCAEGNILKALLNGKVYVGYNGTLIRKSALLRIGALDEKCASHQEFDTHLRLSRKAVYTATNQILSNYYLNGSDTISVDKTKHYDGYSYILLKHRVLWRLWGGYRSLLRKVGRMWYAEQLPRNQRAKIRWRLFRCVPEVLLLLPYFKSKVR